MRAPLSISICADSGHFTERRPEPLPDFEFGGNPHLAEIFHQEICQLRDIPEVLRNDLRSAESPVTMSFPFLLSDLSRPALELARHFLPLPYFSTVQRHYGWDIRQLEERIHSSEKI
jgi:hypothetical protein